MPSQSSFEGEGTFDHLIETVSPDLVRAVGVTVSVAGADRDRVGARKRRIKRGIIFNFRRGGVVEEKLFAEGG